MEFWQGLGFSFNPQFTDEKAAALVLGDNIFAMLLLPDFFKTFTKKELVNALHSTEAINAISVESRDLVNQIVENAVRLGGEEYRPAEDHGWMYGRVFSDLDGHQWEVLHIDESKLGQ